MASLGSLGQAGMTLLQQQILSQYALMNGLMGQQQQQLQQQQQQIQQQQQQIQQHQKQQQQQQQQIHKIQHMKVAGVQKVKAQHIQVTMFVPDNAITSQVLAFSLLYCALSMIVYT